MIPVTNCGSHALISLSNDSTTCKYTTQSNRPNISNELINTSLLKHNKRIEGFHGYVTIRTKHYVMVEPYNTLKTR